MKVTLSRETVRGKPQWVVSRGEGGKRKRRFFASKELALAEVADIKERLKLYGETWTSLPAPDRARLIDAYAAATEKGLDLVALIENAEKPAVIPDAPALTKAIEEMIAAKAKAGRSEDYVSSLDQLLTQFARGREGSTIDEVGLADVEAFLDSKCIQSRSTIRARLSTLFKFAIRRGWRADNPCARLEPITVTKPPPMVFTVEQCEKCLEWLRLNPRAGAWFVLSACCGLRPEEAEKTRPEDIHQMEGWIRVEAQTTKVRQRRVVYPRPEAMALLALAVKSGADLPLAPQPRRRTIRELRKVVGWLKWPKDVTRHTAASYWLAAGAGAADLAESLGHSEMVLRRHYKALVTHEEAARFWALVESAARRKPATKGERQAARNARCRVNRWPGKVSGTVQAAPPVPPPPAGKCAARSV